jgi:hypothetical protein
VKRIPLVKKIYISFPNDLIQDQLLLLGCITLTKMAFCKDTLNPQQKEQPRHPLPRLLFII